MGVGGSTSSRPGSATVLVKSRPPSDVSSRGLSAHISQPSDSNRPTGSCCSHYRKNHSTVTRTVTPVPVTSPPPGDNIDDDIEEIVANTLDLVSSPKSERTDPTPNEVETNIEMVRFSAGRSIEDLDTDANQDSEQKISSAPTTRIVQKRPSNEISEDSEESPNDAKGATIAPNGRVMHHQESDLLWRLGLISPEAYKINTGPRSAPSNQGPYLKTPSYDLTEEQLMANIEKEFECTTAI